MKSFKSVLFIWPSGFDILDWEILWVDGPRRPRIAAAWVHTATVTRHMTVVTSAGWAGPRAQPQAACRQYRFNFRIRPLSRLWYDQPMILPGWLERRTGNYLTLRLGTSCVRPRFKRTRSHQTHRAPAQGTRACSMFAGVHYGSGPDKLHSMWQNSDQTVERTF